MTYPRIFLAIDNCFASKRWTSPGEWMKVIKGLGLSYIEASADNECDPLYMGEEYLKEWADDVLHCSAELGVKVANLYSGHGTYATLGLAHTDKRIRDRFLERWLKPMAATAGKIGAGLGFFCHAFSDSVLQDPSGYAEMEEDLYSRLAGLSEYAAGQGCLSIGLEQMYTPHQIPWTVNGAQKLIHKVYQKCGKPFYITIDAGHQCGQRRFMRPSYGKIKEMLRMCRNGEPLSGIWLGPGTANKLFEGALHKSGHIEDRVIAEIEAEMDKYPHLFAGYEDGDPYVWLEKLGCYSPIIHLQQTTGLSSSHLAFTEENNKNGIIKAERLLKSLFYSYQSEDKPDMPEKCREIYLTLEMFTGTAAINRDTLKALKDSVEYWRRFIPEDGITLDRLVSTI